MKTYEFDYTIDKVVLENYLAKAVTAQELVNSETLKDDIRAIGNIGAKFLGRSSACWTLEDDDQKHFENCHALAVKVHELDKEIILQTCIFEAIDPGLNQVEVPAWVFEAFDLPYEKRNFIFDRMLFDNAPLGFIWENGGGIPNINKLEVQMWFYYRACRYIDAGFEAIHMGQIHLYTADDIGFVKTYAVFNKIRDYAKKHARRHMVIMDAHTHGVSVNNHLLFDFHSMPLTRMPLLDRLGDKLVFVREGYSDGGITPSGWSCDRLPWLVEFDNWGGKFFKEEDNIAYEVRAWQEWWGYDQITWFANQDYVGRNHYLEYAYKWLATSNVNAYLQMPFRRTIGSCTIPMETSTGVAMQDCYQCNTQTEQCPMGFGQEETIKQIWSMDYTWLRNASNPWNREDYGAQDCYDQETGVKLPSRVIIFGNFQHHMGAFNYDSNSEQTRMYYVGDNKYSLTCVFPFTGTFDYAVSLCGTLSQVYSIDTYPRSGSATKSKLVIEKDNTIVKFTYQFMSHEVKAEIISESCNI